MLSRLTQKQPDVFSRAVCHLAALCAAAGVTVLPLSIDVLQIDISTILRFLQKDVPSLQ